MWSVDVLSVFLRLSREGNDNYNDDGNNNNDNNNNNNNNNDDNELIFNVFCIFFWRNDFGNNLFLR